MLFLLFLSVGPVLIGIIYSFSVICNLFLSSIIGRTGASVSPVKQAGYRLLLGRFSRFVAEAGILSGCFVMWMLRELAAQLG